MGKGEFEASPVETKPSVIYKRKSNPVLGIMTIVFALATIGLGVWVAILSTNKPKDEAKVSGSETGQQASAPSKGESGETGETTKDARIGYLISGQCTTGALTSGGEFYVWVSANCDMSGRGDVSSMDAVDTATGQNGAFTLTYGPGKDIVEFESVGATDNTLNIDGLKVNDSGIVAVALASIGQGWDGEKYILVKEDGTIDMLWMDFRSADKVRPRLMKNFGGFKNVASAVEVDNGNYVSTVLITRNGGQISMTDALNNLYTDNN